MTAYNATRMAEIAAGTLPEVRHVFGRMKVFNEKVTLAAQASGDTINVARLPAGFVPLYGVLVTDTSLGTATIAVGVSGNTAKYRAAAVFTATDTPTPFGKTAALGEPLASEETVFLTVGTAALPASGTLRVMFVGTIGD